MQEIRAVACNYRLSTPICPRGGKAFVLSVNPGNGSDRIKILARSRGGRWVEKWEDARYLHNFRVVTVVEHQPRFDWIGFCGVAEDPRCAEWIAAMNSGGFYGAGRHIGVDSRARAEEATMASYPWPLMTPPHPDAVDHFVTAPEPEPLTEDDLAALEEKMSWDEPKSWNDFLHVAYYEDVPRLIAEVRRLRDEREALTMTIEAGFASGRCPACEPRFERGGDLYAHDPECPFRNWRQDGIDVAALTATYQAMKAETATFLRQWEAEHPELAEKLRRRVAELAERP